MENKIEKKEKETLLTLVYNKCVSKYFQSKEHQKPLKDFRNSIKNDKKITFPVNS